MPSQGPSMGGLAVAMPKGWKSSAPFSAIFPMFGYMYACVGPRIGSPWKATETRTQLLRSIGQREYPHTTTQACADPSPSPLSSVGPPNRPDCRDTRSLHSPDVLAVSLRRHRLHRDLTLHAGYEQKRWPQIMSKRCELTG